MKDLSKNSRISDKERRDLGASPMLEAENLDRRKRPDRRLGGLDVQVVDVTDTAFMNFIHEFDVKK